MNLRLLQISDSALPIGGYTHSWGLEAAIARRLVGDAESLERFVRNWLWHALGPLEGVIVASCCRAAAKRDWQTVARANAILTASIAPPSIRSASLEMGEQLLALASTWVWSAGGIAAFETGTAAGRDFRQLEPRRGFRALGRDRRRFRGGNLAGIPPPGRRGYDRCGRPGHPGRAHAWPADDRVSS